MVHRTRCKFLKPSAGAAGHDNDQVRRLSTNSGVQLCLCIASMIEVDQVSFHLSALQ